MKQMKQKKIIVDIKIVGRRRKKMRNESFLFATLFKGSIKANERQ